jgi:pyruvate dehydrogenase phosphatase
LLSTTPIATHYTTSAQTAVSPTAAVEETTAETKRRALVVEHDQFFMGDIQGDQPLSKEVDESGRLVMEMLDSDQSTAKLRQKEQSFHVGRGQGVLRYDLTQLASNHPIEDDHVEQIIQVPPKVAPPAEGANSSDWMFWGVFDGHR